MWLGWYYLCINNTPRSHVAHIDYIGLYIMYIYSHPWGLAPESVLDIFSHPLLAMRWAGVLHDDTTLIHRLASMSYGLCWLMSLHLEFNRRIWIRTWILCPLSQQTRYTDPMLVQCCASVADWDHFLRCETFQDDTWNSEKYCVRIPSGSDFVMTSALCICSAPNCS